MQGDAPYTQEEIETMIGKTITGYKPELNTNQDLIQAGTITDGKYTPNDEYTGRESSAAQGTFKTETLGWKIWGIDSDNIYLISAKPTSTTLRLKGAQGYNNGVYILNEICKTCYTDSHYNGVEARSMNIRDIEKLYDNSRGIITYNYQGESDYGTTTYQYNFAWPTAWTKYDEKDTKPFENRSKQETLIQSGEATQTESNKSPKNIYWFQNFGRTAGSHIGFAETEEAKAYASLIFDNGSNLLPQYWLGSRFAARVGRGLVELRLAVCN